MSLPMHPWLSERPRSCCGWSGERSTNKYQQHDDHSFKSFTKLSCLRSCRRAVGIVGLGYVAKPLTLPTQKWAIGFWSDIDQPRPMPLIKARATPSTSTGARL